MYHSSGGLREAFLHRWLGGIPQQYQTGNTLQGETNSGTWPCIVAGLVGLAHRDGDQADGQQTAHRGRAPNEPRFDGASGTALAAFKGRASAQHVFHRTLEWNGERTTGDVNTQVSPCCSSAPGA